METGTSEPNREALARLRLPAVAVLVLLVIVRVLPVLGDAEAFPILSGFVGIAFLAWLVRHWLLGGHDADAAARWWTWWLVVAAGWVALSTTLHAYRHAFLLAPAVAAYGLAGALRARRAHGPADLP